MEIITINPTKEPLDCVTGKTKWWINHQADVKSILINFSSEIGDIYEDNEGPDQPAHSLFSYRILGYCGIL